MEVLTNSFKFTYSVTPGSEDKIEHEVFVMNDNSHLAKNIRGALFSYDFLLAPDVVKKNNLPGNRVSLSHIYMLHEFQEGQMFKYAPKLDKNSFPKPGYGRMKVAPATDCVFSEDVAAGLRMLVYEHKYPKDLLVTAWYVEKGAFYWRYSSSRSSNFAFHLGKEEENQQILQGLQEFSDIMNSMTFDCKTGSQQKPIQNGVRLQVAGLISMEKFFIQEMKMVELLPGRFSSDCVENFFSQVRRRNRAPTPMEFKFAFKALMILHQIKPSKYGNCSTDDDNWLTALKDIKGMQLDHIIDGDEDTREAIVICDKSVHDLGEQMGLVYAIGYTLKKTTCSEYGCDECKKYFVTDTPNLQVHRLIKEKNYAGDKIFPSEEAWKFFSFCWNSLDWNKSLFLAENVNPEAFVDKFHKTALSLLPTTIPKCCLDKLIRRFVKICLFWWGRQLTREIKSSTEYKEVEEKAAFASRSMGGHFASNYGSRA